MLSIDEAISRARKVAEEQRELFSLCLYPSQECNGSDICKCLKNKHDGCLKCAEEHEQLANWLEELKAFKENSISKEAFEKMKSKSYQYGYRQGYSKAIDDVLKLTKYTFYDTSNEFMNIRIDAISIEDILKLKEKTNE